jgi:hypothetical protein
MAMLIAIGLGGCGTETPAGDAASEGAPSAAEGEQGGDIDNSQTTIEYQVQEYGDGEYGPGPVEIPMFTYDGGQPAFDATDHKNPALEAINLSIRNELLDPLNASAGSEDQWMEIRAYPFTSPEYLQVICTMATFPNYGDDGEVFSWVFDREANQWVEPEDVYAAAGLTGDALLVAVREAFEPENDGESVVSVEPAAFMYYPDSSAATVPVFLVEAKIDNPEGDPWRGLFGYATVNDETILEHLDPAELFDPSEPDQTDPPLAYARGAGGDATPALMFQLPLDAEVELTDQGEDSEGNPYANYISNDSLVKVTIRRGSDVAATDDQGIFDQVTASVSDAVEQNGSWYLEPSEETSTAYTYPAHVFEYDEGQNEDLWNHLGLYFATDAGSWIVDAGMDADNYDEGHAIVEDWLKHLRLVDPA